MALATAAALPLLARLRRLGAIPDDIVGSAAGAESACAASGLPAVSAVETIPVDEPELAAGASGSDAHDLQDWRACPRP